MAQHISAEKAALILDLYTQCGVYAVVARLTGCAPATVARIVRRAAQKREAASSSEAPPA